jgi:hypothetical protein
MKNFDLEERTYRFAKDVVLFCKKLPHTISNIEYLKQLLRASASVGANYIEANEKKFQRKGEKLLSEATELKKIFSSIIEKTK